MKFHGGLTGEFAWAHASLPAVCAGLMLVLMPHVAQAKTWGTQPFDNDAAQGFLQELKLVGSDSLTSAVKRVNDEKAVVAADICSAAIAAASIIAAGRDGVADQLPADAASWLQKTRFKPDDELSTQAKNAVTTCRRAKTSELYMNWMALANAPMWLDMVKSLIRRLEN